MEDTLSIFLLGVGVYMIAFFFRAGKYRDNY